ncbi:MAG: LysR family transcriptional regulator [Betaproteobacteria bacterium]|nr:LysR family transcriptional regulator [Betaproteobacteria bacterium]
MPRKSDPTPALDFFRGFEAAARHLSFTKAAEELFVTQSAISRQIQALEERLGVALFVRRNRGLALTEAGEQMYRAAGIALRTLREAADRIAPGTTQKMVTVTSSMAFCSLWLIPRLAGFRRMHSDVDVRISANNQLLDLDRERIDLAVRYCPARVAPAGSVRLFGEEILPVCSPALLRDRSRPLKSVADLERQVLLHFDDPERSAPWLSWNVWLETAGVPDLRPAGTLRFNHYDQVISAALGGQGVAIGRRPLVRNLLDEGLLATPFTLGAVTDRAYFIVRTAATAGRAEVDDFVQWLRSESVLSSSAAGGEEKPKKRRARKGK